MTYVVEELYALYTKRFTHTDIENGLPVTYEPESVCNEEEVRQIWEETATQDKPPYFWPNSTARLHAALDAMRARVGTSGIPKARHK